jgi:hypothetical protein
MILTIAKLLAIWTLASIIAAFVLARFFHAASQGQRNGQAHEPRRGGEVDFIQHGEAQ